MNESDVRWHRYLAVVVAVVVAVCVVVFHSRLSADFWPLDRSFIGPNLVASLVQAAIVVIVAALIWPPTRRRIHGFLDRKLAPLHDSLIEHRTRSREHNEWVAKHLAELYEHQIGKPPEPHPNFELKSGSQEGASTAKRRQG